MSGSESYNSQRDIRDKGCFAVIRNIPKNFHSSDLRCYFSQLIEEKAFACFHYKHRPEVVGLKDGITLGNIGQHKQTCVCVVKFKNSEFCDHCLSMFHGKNWIDKTGEYIKEKCVILKLNYPSTESIRKSFYLTRQEKNHLRRHAEKTDFSDYDLQQLSEMNPPVKVMPNGNVGTPTAVFQELIRQCKLPSVLIKKLGLVFPKTGSNRRYGNVPFKYDDDDDNFEQNSATTGSIKSARKINQTSNCSFTGFPLSVDTKQCNFSDTEETAEKDDSDSHSDDDNCQEWERHEALHSDVTSQERSKERLFEEDIELKWEKGGSGLVFYTDAQFWAEEEGDFDEQTADDWDVDMSEFYGEDGDRDAKEYVKICKEKRLRSGQSMRRNRTSSCNHKQQNQVGAFEKHTKGIGGRIMTKLGWKEHQSLGPDRNRGLKEPLLAEGQASRERKGLGYFGEKLQSHSSFDNAETIHSNSKPRETSVRNAALNNMKKENPIHRSVEPLASHSYIFPQYRSNLTRLHDTHRPWTVHERKYTVPGVDGIVISTKYDEPLDVDEDSGILRSQHGTALKRRIKHQEEPNTSQSQSKVPLVPIKTGSKLVKRCNVVPETLSVFNEASTTIRSYPSIMIPLKFVRPSNPDERVV